MAGTIRVRDRRAKGDDSLVLTDNFHAPFFLFLPIKCEDMYVCVVYVFMRSCVDMPVCVCVCVRCAYPIIFESHLRETSVACHLQKMRVVDIKGEDQ